MNDEGTWKETPENRYARMLVWARSQLNSHPKFMATPKPERS